MHTGEHTRASGQLLAAQLRAVAPHGPVAADVVPFDDQVENDRLTAGPGDVDFDGVASHLHARDRKHRDDVAAHRPAERAVLPALDSQCDGDGVALRDEVESVGPNRIDVFVRGIDNALYTKSWDGNQWSDYVGLGGDLTSGPAVCSWAAGRLDVFARGTDDALWHLWYDGLIK